MFRLLQPEAVTVIRPMVERDDLGEPTVTGETSEAVNAVVQPGTTQDMDATRPNGASVSYTLHFPKTYTEDLRGCSVEVRGGRYRVVGDPMRYTSANTPGEWGMTVEVGEADG